jgi:hypothetical protein
MDDYRSKLVKRHHACGLDYSVQALGGWALRTRYKVCEPSRNAVKIRKKSDKIPTKYGIPKIRTEKHHPRFRSHSVPIPDFSENMETGRSNVKKRTVRNGKNSVRFQP